MRKNKLYTVNKWNKPIFTLNIDRTHQNVFDGMFGSNLNTSSEGLNFWNLQQANQQQALANSSFGQNMGYNPINQNALTGITGPQVNTSILPDIGNSINQDNLNTAIQHGNEGISNIKQNLPKTNVIGNFLKSNAGIIGSAVGTVGNKVLSGGLNSGAGNTISSIGSTVGGAISAVNPVVGGIVSAASGIVGGGVNALFGTKVNQEKLNAANEGTNYLNTFNSSASSYDDVQGPNAVANIENAYKGGVFKKNWAKKKNAELRAKRIDAAAFANRSIDNNIENISDTQMDTMLANYAAYGGPLGRTVNPADYNNLSNYLLTRSKINKDNQYALGGDIQANGGDYTTGLTHIDTGGSHEENPNDGVQIGISKENGNPNLVEEGETIFDNYVYSKRIEIDDKTKEKFHIGKKRNITFADLSKKLEKESLERPNDPISQAGLRKQMHDLADEQERQKKEMQDKEAEEAFEQLPPEQQQAIMQQVAIEEAQEQQAQQQQMQELQVPLQAEQSTEEQMLQQQQIEQPQTENNYKQLNACGGYMNRFDNGGDMKRKIYRLLDKIYTDSDFSAWAKKNNIDSSKIDWDKALENKVLMSAIGKANPAIADVISRGYDFGKYTHSKDNTLTFDFKHGGWGAEDYNAWNGSTDAAWTEAVKKGLVKEGMNSEEIGNALKQTDAYKRGSDWLKASEDNRLLYLQQIYNSPDAPQAAKDYAAKYIDKNGWLKEAKRDYQTIFEDPNGTGVRNTHPGTYWKTPEEILREKKLGNLVVNKDGSVEEIYGDIPKDWVLSNTYSWQDANSDNTYNYYKRPDVKAEEAKNNDYIIKPIHKSTFERTLGAQGPLIALGMQQMGIGKPNYSNLNSALNTVTQAPILAHANTIGNYLTYKPMDIWYEQNRMNANARATDRAIMNNASPTGTKTAGLLANGYNNQIASGDLYRKALEYNDAQRQRVAEFNRGTNQYNADALTKVSMANADIQNRNRQLKAQMALDIAKEKMNSDASWYNSIYGNVNNYFKNLSNIGKENAQHNMIADMAADGVFGTISDQQYSGKGFVERVNKSSKGGKLNRRKRGLTF